MSESTPDAKGPAPVTVDPTVSGRGDDLGVGRLSLEDSHGRQVLVTDGVSIPASVAVVDAQGRVVARYAALPATAKDSDAYHYGVDGNSTIFVSNSIQISDFVGREERRLTLEYGANPTP